MVQQRNLGLTKHLSKILTLAILAIVIGVLFQVSPPWAVFTGYGEADEVRVVFADDDDCDDDDDSDDDDPPPPIPNGNEAALAQAIIDANNTNKPDTIILVENGTYQTTDTLRRRRCRVRRSRSTSPTSTRDRPLLNGPPMCPRGSRTARSDPTPG